MGTKWSNVDLHGWTAVVKITTGRKYRNGYIDWFNAPLQLKKEAINDFLNVISGHLRQNPEKRRGSVYFSAGKSQVTLPKLTISSFDVLLASVLEKLNDTSSFIMLGTGEESVKMDCRESIEKLAEMFVEKIKNGQWKAKNYVPFYWKIHEEVSWASNGMIQKALSILEKKGLVIKIRSARKVKATIVVAGFQNRAFYSVSVSPEEIKKALSARQKEINKNRKPRATKATVDAAKEVLRLGALRGDARFIQEGDVDVQGFADITDISIGTAWRLVGKAEDEKILARRGDAVIVREKKPADVLPSLPEVTVNVPAEKDLTDLSVDDLKKRIARLNSEIEAREKSALAKMYEGKIADIVDEMRKEIGNVKGICYEGGELIIDMEADE